MKGEWREGGERDGEGGGDEKRRDGGKKGERDRREVRG